MSQTRPVIDLLLSGVSSMFVPEGFIADGFLPPVKSKAKTGKLAKYGTSHLRIENSVKGGRGAYRRVETISRTTTGYDIDGHGLEGMVTADDYNNVQLPFKAEEDETMGVTLMLKLEKEKVLADALTSTSIITQNTTLVGTSQLSDYDNSDPLTVFSAARVAVRNGCGLPPNVVAMDWLVKNKLKFHPVLLDYLGFKQNRPGGLTDQELAMALDVDEIRVAKAMYETAKENQTSSLAPIWGKHISFSYIPAKAVPYQQSLGYEVGYENDTPRKVYKQPSFNPPNGTIILVEDNYDFLLSNVLCSYLVKNAIA